MKKKYKVVVYDRSRKELNTWLMWDLIDAGFNVEKRWVQHPRYSDYMVSQAWVEFDTEADAAIFKLTYL